MKLKKIKALSDHGRSAYWETEDGAFTLYSSIVKPFGWCVIATSTQGKELIASNGIAEARFKTRAEALSALAMAGLASH